MFEHILVNLDFATLLLAQRVSTAWRDFIKDNDNLQKKLFLKPATFKEAVGLGMVEDGDVVMTSPCAGSGEEVRVLNHGHL